MKGHLITFILLCSLSFFAQGQKRSSISIYFDPGQSSIRSTEREKLITLVDSLSKTGDWTLYLEGHTDSIGSDSYNEELSARRVKAVDEFLESKGLAMSKVKEGHHGEKRPASGNATPAGRQKNRRVEIVIVQEAKAPVAEEESGDNIRDLFRLLQTPQQSFCINNDRDTIITGEDGTIIRIPAGSFGKVAKSKCVNVKLKENFTRSSMLLDDLTTTSNGQILESQGMINITADLDGKSMELAFGKQITVLLPTDTVIPGMKVFFGDRTGHDSIMNWSLGEGSRDMQGFSAGQLKECLPFFGDINQCNTFRCKVERFFNRVFRKKSAPRAPRRDIPQNCKNLKDLLDKYGVTNLKDLQAAIRKENEERIQKSIAEGTATPEDLQYYIFNTPKLGWINADKFANFPPESLISYKVNTKPGPDKDVKLVFKNIKSVLPGKEAGTYYQFDRVPKGELVWVVAMRFSKGKIFLSMQETTISTAMVATDFKEYTLEELKKELKKLDL